jgi:hypothetical protein
VHTIELGARVVAQGIGQALRIDVAPVRTARLSGARPERFDACPGWTNPRWARMP